MLSKALSRVGKTASGFGKAVSDTVTAAGSSAVQGVQDLLPQLPFQEVCVPVFLVPTGPGADDYILTLDLEESFALLNSGVLPRPVFQVWSSRSDLDREILAQRLTDQFTTHFSEVKRKHAREIEQKKAEVADDEKAKNLSEGTYASIEMILTALISMLLATNPVVDFLFLAIAVLGGGALGTQLVKIVVQFLMSLVKGVTDNQSLKALEKEVNNNQAKVNQGLKRVRVHIHARLRVIALMISEVENQPLMSESDIEEGPDVSALLENPELRHQLPTEFVVFYQTAAS